VSDDEDRATVAWRAGRRHAWVSVLNIAVREIGDQRSEAALRQELEDVRGALRDLCKDFGDNDWADDLHLGDVVRKHLAKHLYDARDDDSDLPSHPCPTCGQTVYSEAVARLFESAEKCIDANDVEGARIHLDALQAELGENDPRVVGLGVAVHMAEPLRAPNGEVSAMLPK
jgi:hypothetical protein